MSKLIIELYGYVLGTISKNGSRFDFEVDYNVFEKYPLSFGAYATSSTSKFSDFR
jgi:hypothetical protein